MFGARRARSIRTAPYVVALVLFALVVPGRARADGTTSPIWATAQAEELTRQGSAHAARGEVDIAARRFLQAIEFDATYGPAYLALGRLHESVGDPREGERAYSLGIEHIGGFAEGLLARASLRSRQHRIPEAIADLAAAVEMRPDDLGVLQLLARAYISVNALPAALAVTRRIEALAESHHDTAASASAHVSARALARLVSEADPVSAGLTKRGTVRRMLALRAR